MQAGKLRHRVTIERMTEYRDVQGGRSLNWETLVTRWASIEPLSARERFEAEQVKSRATHRLRLRYTDLSSADRVLFGNRVFNIEAVLNAEERGSELELLCIEGD